VTQRVGAPATSAPHVVATVKVLKWLTAAVMV
jgi:hypothetical protein